MRIGCSTRNIRESARLPSSGQCFVCVVYLPLVQEHPRGMFSFSLPTCAYLGPTNQPNTDGLQGDMSRTSKNIFILYGGYLSNKENLGKAEKPKASQETLGKTFENLRGNQENLQGGLGPPDPPISSPKNSPKNPLVTPLVKSSTRVPPHLVGTI